MVYDKFVPHASYTIGMHFQVQWNKNGGRCGICGDPYNGPRDNEAGGRFATGIIAKRYTEGQTITVSLDITVNHGGYFEFRMCPNNNPRRPATGINIHF